MGSLPNLHELGKLDGEEQGFKPGKIQFNFMFQGQAEPNWHVDSQKSINQNRSRMENLSKMSKEDVNKVFETIETVLIDCEGVLWVNMDPVPGAAEAVNMLKQKGKHILLFSNNTIIPRDDFVIKAKRYGMNIDKPEMLTTSSLVVSYLRTRSFQKKVFVIGSMGLKKELQDAGIRHLDIGPDEVQKSIYHTVEMFHPDPDVEAVVVGFDEHFSYPKLLKAASYLNKPKCLFLSTNESCRCVFNSKIVVPGTGAIVKAVEAASKRKAYLVGKPSNCIIKMLINNYGVHPSKTMIIGDNSKTDIEMGSKNGFKTLLVFTGLTQLEQITAWKNSNVHDDKHFVPDYYCSKLGDLVKLL